MLCTFISRHKVNLAFFFATTAVTDDHCPRSINLRLQDGNILILIIFLPFISWSMSMKRDFCRNCLSSNTVWWWKSGSTLTPFHLSNFKIMSWLSSIIQKSPIRFFVLSLWTHGWKRVWCVSIHYRCYLYWCPQRLCLAYCPLVSLILHKVSPVPLL